MDTPASGEPAAPGEPPLPTPVQAEHPFTFSGDGGTYFGIWIVNILLTVVTLGIYSPWAKVRRLRYFYGNTLLDGSPFEFHGSPIAILKGRLIGLVLLLAYSQTMKFSLTLWYVVVACIAVALPWILWRSLRFRLANSSYRSIRFGFGGSLRDAYLTFVLPIAAFIAPTVLSIVAQAMVKPGAQPQTLWPLAVISGVVVLAAAVCAPWLYQRIKRYQHGNARLGSALFTFHGTVGQSYGLSFATFGYGLLATVAMAALFGVASYAFARLLVAEGAPGIAAGMAAAGAYLGMLSIWPVGSVLAQNYVWGHTALASHAMASRARPWAIWKIGLQNFVLLVITIGLYWPFAVVRMTRYRVSTLAWAGDPAALVAAAQADGAGAAGEETAELFGFDLAL